MQVKRVFGEDLLNVKKTRALGMAEDVDKAVPLEDEEEKEKKRKKSVNNDGDQSAKTRRIWAFWTLFTVACVPVIGTVIQCFRTAQISERHVSAKFADHAFFVDPFLKQDDRECTGRFQSINRCTADSNKQTNK